MEEARKWLIEQLGMAPFEIAVVAGDASFRSYYRIKMSDRTYILMVAPPDKERTDPFVTIARHWEYQGLAVPKVLAWEPVQGWVLLSDFGDNLLFNSLTSDTVDHFYQMAMQSLSLIQKTVCDLPPFDETHIRLELSYFQDWFIDKLLQIKETPGVRQMREAVFDSLVACCEAQPAVTIHRDYHSRNLMVLPEGELGIIDFQDAMVGPITYDLASLLKDCYIDWPRHQVQTWVKQFQEKLTQENRLQPMDESVFLKWFDCTGLQRHLKVLGVFSRLKLRDNKPQYLEYIPRIMNYILEVCHHYPEFEAFGDWLQSEVNPFWQAQNSVQVA